MSWRDALVLGRVSNLPTVWSNVLAGVALAGGSAAPAPLLLALLALSLAYIAGMYLNDAFDAGIDARERPERPIPAGRVRRGTVLAAGWAMLAGMPLLLAAAGAVSGAARGFWPALSGLALAGAIVAYDRYHKGNPFSPLLMGLCRVLVYVSAALTVAVALPDRLLLGALALLAWLFGLTFTAKQERLGRMANRWPLALLAVPPVYGLALAAGEPITLGFAVLLAAAAAAALRLIRVGRIPAAVGTMIAAIALVDAVLIAGAGSPGLALLAALAFPLTLALQRVIPGT